MPPVSALRRYNPLSVLRNINLADVDEINKTMHCLARCLDTSGERPGSKRIAEQALAALDMGPIYRIVRAIERNTDYPLLRMAIERLLEARDRSRLEILGAVSELEHLAEEKVLINPTLYINDYANALDRFLELPPLQFGQFSRNFQPSKNGEATNPRSKRSLSGGKPVAPSPEQSQTESSTSSGPSISETAKPRAPRKRLPSLPSSNLPNSKIPRTKANPSTPRRKRPTPISEEYAVSSPPTPSSTTPKKRGKSPKACNECRRRKIKCLRDEGDDCCLSCSKLGRDCILSPPSSAKSAVRGSLKRAAPEDPLETPIKKQATAGKSESSMKNIMHYFGDLKEGKALGIVSEADDENSCKGSDGPMEVMQVSKVLELISDSEDFDYNPNKRVCRGGKKGRSKSIRKQSILVVE